MRPMAQADVPSPSTSAFISDDPVLARYRAALDDFYGDTIERVVLFGSRARGDFHAESDYDVAVFRTVPIDLWDEMRRLADLSVDFIDDTGVVFDTKSFRAGSYHDRTPIMHEIRRDGRDL